MNKTEEKQISNILLENYLHLQEECRDVAFTPCDGHGINSKNAVLTFSEGHEYVLKIVTDKDQILQKLKVSELCRKQGAKLPEIFATKMGSIATPYNSSFLVLMRYYSGENFSGARCERKSAAYNLATLNRALRENDVPLHRMSKYADLSGKELTTIASASKKSSDAFDVRVSLFCEEIPLLCNMLSDNLPDEDNMLIYQDFHPGNAFFRNGELEVILDPGSIVTGSRLLSIAFAADRFSETIVEAADFINSYIEKDPLQRHEDIDKIPYFIIREALNRINYILRGSYFEGNREWNSEFLKHQRTIERVRKNLPLYQEAFERLDVSK